MAQKYSSPTRYNDSLNESITKGNRESARVFQPQWVNNQTRLNSSNVELMRSNLMSYIEKIVASLHDQTNRRFNQTQKESAGWVVFEDSGGILGEVFNEEPIDNSTSTRNNAVSIGKKYQAVFGQCNIANGNAQFVCGKYNSEVADALLIVGCGNDTDSRNNALVVSKDGDIQLYKDVIISENLQVGGTTTLKDTLVVNNGTEDTFKVTKDGNTTITGSLTVNKNLTVGNDTTLGNADTDKTTIKGILTVDATSTFNKNVNVTESPTDETHVVRKKELDDLRSEISNALHYIGVTSTELNDKSTNKTVDINGSTVTVNAGDVVICKGSNKEFIFDGTYWYDYGSSDNYVLKKIYDADKENIEKNISDETTARENADAALLGTTTDDASELTLYGLQKLIESKDIAATLSQDITTTITVGELPEGSEIKAGTALDNILQSILSATKQPTAVEPSATIQLLDDNENIITKNTLLEIGSKININYKTTFSPGSYTYGPATGCTPTKSTVGFGKEIYNLDLSSEIPELVLDNYSNTLGEYQVPDTYVRYLYLTYGYNSSTSTPLDNKGNIATNASTIKIGTAGGCESQSSTYIRGYRNYWYGFSTTTGTTSNDIHRVYNETQDDVMAGDNVLTPGNAAISKKTLPTITAEDGDKMVVVIMPSDSGRVVASATMPSSLNAPVTFTKKAKLTIPGANGYDGIGYDIWTYTPPNMPTGASFSIVIG